MNSSLRELIKEIPESHPMNDMGIFNNAMLSKLNDNLVTVSMFCILDTENADNIQIEALEEREMYQNLIGKKIIEIGTIVPGTGNHLWYISESFLLDSHIRIVEARIKDGSGGKRGGRTMVKMSTSGDNK